MINLDELKIIIDNSPLSDNIKKEFLDSVSIFYEYLNFLALKLKSTVEVADKSFQLNYKIELTKKFEELNPSDDNFVDIAIDVMIDMAKKEGFLKLDELRKSSKILLTLKV